MTTLAPGCPRDLPHADTFDNHPPNARADLAHLVRGPEHLWGEWDDVT